MQIVVLMGPPAAGKGTQAAFLEQLGFFSFSTGHYIREQAAKGDPACVEALELSAQGRLASDELVVGIVSVMIEQKMAEGVRGVILDGFPRTVAQAKALEEIVAAKNIPLTAVEIVAAEEELDRRREDRRRVALSKGEEPRKDDDPAVFRKRMVEYYAKTAPVTPFFKSLGRLVQIDGLPAPEIVRQAIFKALGLDRSGPRPDAPQPL